VSGPPLNDQPPDESAPGSAWVGGSGDRVGSLAAYFVDHAGRFTPEALHQAARDGGFSPEEIEAADARAVTALTAAEATRPTRTLARRVVLVVYGLVYAAFAVALVTSSSLYGAGVIALVILTIVLGIALWVSLAWINRRGRKTVNPDGALATMLVVPVVLLVAVSGLCVATTRPFGF
jgi:hypothetical protein